MHLTNNSKDIIIAALIHYEQVLRDQVKEVNKRGVTTQGLRLLKELEAATELKRDVYFENVGGL